MVVSRLVKVFVKKCSRNVILAKNRDEKIFKSPISRRATARFSAERRLVKLFVKNGSRNRILL